MPSQSEVQTLHYANSDKQPNLGDRVEPVFGGKQLVVCKIGGIPNCFENPTFNGSVVLTDPTMLRLVGVVEESVYTTSNQTRR